MKNILEQIYTPSLGKFYLLLGPQMHGCYLVTWYYRSIQFIFVGFDGVKVSIHPFLKYIECGRHW